jgi:NADH:ubiquinone reductase (H+-translocating)
LAHHVVIVGGGFGGLEAARQLKHADVRVTVIDRQNYHLFQPLLYQVATAGLSPADIASPIRNLLASAQNVEVRMAEVRSVDLAGRRVSLSNGELSFDSLVLAAGVRHSYFGKPQWEGDAPGLKTLDDALEIRRRVLLAFENAERADDEAVRAAWLTFVVVGAGPTGVELAGAITELARFTIAKDFRRFDPRSAKVVLVEAGDRVLSAFHPALSRKAHTSLQELHVDVRLQTRVMNITADGVQLPDAFLPARTVLWAAGVEAPALSRTLHVELDRSGRIKVQPDLSVPGHPDVYVIGDLAFFPLADGSSLPGLAPVALQQGRCVAKNIEAALHRTPKQPFTYVDKGMMATIGRASGIAQAGALRLSGMIGWLAWLFIHILFLIGFRNRLIVMLQWAWAWVTYGRGARLITGTTPVPESGAAEIRATPRPAEAAEFLK